MDRPLHKEYIGDGVYAAWDGATILLTTSDGVQTTNEIVLEPEVWRALVEYVHRTVQNLG